MSTKRRGPDIVARVGGDEFAMLLPETDLVQAQVVADRLRQELKERPLSVEGHAVIVTVSIGLAETRPLAKGWISALRSSRQPLRGFLRMRNYINAINDIPHAEERPARPRLEARTVLEALRAGQPAPAQYQVRPGEPSPPHPSPVLSSTPQAAAAEAKQHAAEAASSAADSKKQADTAQAAPVSPSRARKTRAVPPRPISPVTTNRSPSRSAFPSTTAPPTPGETTARHGGTPDWYRSSRRGTAAGPDQIASPNVRKKTSARGGRVRSPVASANSRQALKFEKKSITRGVVSIGSHCE